MRRVNDLQSCATPPSSPMGRPSFVSLKGFLRLFYFGAFPSVPIINRSSSPFLIPTKLVNQHNKAAEQSSSDKLARKLRKEISACVLVLHTEHPTMQSASEVRTFWPVLTTSKVCWRVKTRFRLGVLALAVMVGVRGWGTFYS